MTDAEAEDEAPVGRIGREHRGLGANIGKPQIDVGDPGADLEVPGRRAHQLGRRHRIVVDLGAEYRLEPAIFGCPCDILDLAGAPSRAPLRINLDQSER